MLYPPLKLVCWCWVIGGVFVRSAVADVKFKLGDKEYTGFDAVADRFHAIIKATVR
jgi:hypothetical protein